MRVAPPKPNILRPPPAHAPTAPARPHRTRAPLRFAVRRAALRRARCLSRPWAPAPGRILPPPALHGCQRAPAVSDAFGSGREYSTPLPAPGKTLAGSTRSIRTLQLTDRPLAGSAGVAYCTPVLHSCSYFIIEFVSGTDGLL